MHLLRVATERLCEDDDLFILASSKDINTLSHRDRVRFSESLNQLDCRDHKIRDISLHHSLPSDTIITGLPAICG